MKFCRRTGDHVRILENITKHNSNLDLLMDRSLYSLPDPSELRQIYALIEVNNDNRLAFSSKEAFILLLNGARFFLRAGNNVLLPKSSTMSKYFYAVGQRNEDRTWEDLYLKKFPIYALAIIANELISNVNQFSTRRPEMLRVCRDFFKDCFDFRYGPEGELLRPYNTEVRRKFTSTVIHPVEKALASNFQVHKHDLADENRVPIRRSRSSTRVVELEDSEC